MITDMAYFGDIRLNRFHFFEWAIQMDTGKKYMFNLWNNSSCISEQKKKFSDEKRSDERRISVHQNWKKSFQRHFRRIQHSQE